MLNKRIGKTGKNRREGRQRTPERHLTIIVRLGIVIKLRGLAGPRREDRFFLRVA